MTTVSVAAHLVFALLSVGAYALHLPFPVGITTLVPIVVGGGWVAAPYVSSLKTAQTIRRPRAAAAHLAAAAVVFGAGLWAYLAPPARKAGAGASLLVYMLVPLLQAITLTVAGAAAKAGERRRPPLASPGAGGGARDGSEQKG